MQLDSFFDEDQNGKLEVMDLLILAMAFVKMVCSEFSKLLTIGEKVLNTRPVVTGLTKFVQKTLEATDLTLPVKIDDLVGKMVAEGEATAMHQTFYALMQEGQAQMAM